MRKWGVEAYRMEKKMDGGSRMRELPFQTDNVSPHYIELTQWIDPFDDWFVGARVLIHTP
jgi:hypothetical protein